MEDSIKDGMNITTTTAETFFAFRASNIQLPTDMDIKRFAGGICEGILVKEYAVYKNCINR